MISRSGRFCIIFITWTLCVFIFWFWVCCTFAFVSQICFACCDQTSPFLIHPVICFCFTLLLVFCYEFCTINFTINTTLLPWNIEQYLLLTGAGGVFCCIQLLTEAGGVFCCIQLCWKKYWLPCSLVNNVFVWLVQSVKGEPLQRVLLIHSCMTLHEVRGSPLCTDWLCSGFHPFEVGNTSSNQCAVVNCCQRYCNASGIHILLYSTLVGTDIKTSSYCR